MIRHIVMWNLKEEAEGATKATNGKLIKQRLEALNGVIPELTFAEVGINFNPDGYDLCLCSNFADKASLDVYQNHPAHVEVKEFINKVVQDRVVCDYEF